MQEGGTTVKRGFLFGLGWFLIVGVIYCFIQLLQGYAGIVNVVMLLICMPSSVVVIRAAKKSAPNRSKLYAVVGWLIGFFVIDAAFLAVFLPLLYWWG